MTVSEPFFSPRSGTNPRLTGYGVQKRYTGETVWAADTSKAVSDPAAIRLGR